MLYTVWTRGELIGTTELDFEGLGFDRSRSGHFHPNARGDELMHELASRSSCMRAYMHRNYRDAEGNGFVDPAYINSSRFADISEHLHRSAGFELELRDEQNLKIALDEIGIQDREPEVLPLTAKDLLPRDDAELSAEEEELQNIRAQIESVLRTGPAECSISEENLRAFEQMDIDGEAQMTADEADLLFGKYDLIDGGESFNDPYDWDRSEVWECADWQAENALGAGWNGELYELPEFPRYQIHVILAEG